MKNGGSLSAAAAEIRLVAKSVRLWFVSHRKEPRSSPVTATVQKMGCAVL